ncbi:MAG: aminoacyl-tRNA hydrolase [bacterium]|nr:aminoacyl-tRNA hydrolase [bacterium]
MKLIVGLGNPGTQYEGTRHNIGFMVVERLAREAGLGVVAWNEEKKHKALTAKVGDILIVKPQTFMNASGVAVKSLVDYHKLSPEDVWIIHDEIDLPIGKIRIRQKGGGAGHRGVESVMKMLGSDLFVRFRLGVGRGKEAHLNYEGKHESHRSVISFVLSRFGRTEAGELKHLIKRGSDAVRIALHDGLDKAMNRFN